MTTCAEDELCIGPFTVGEKPAPLEYTFQDSSGSAIDLTGYAARFTYREEYDAAGTTVNAIVTAAPAGQVTYTWAGTEFPTPGQYFAQVWAGNGANRYASPRIRFTARSAVGAVPAI